jgi:hypothetical protein
MKTSTPMPNTAAREGERRAPLARAGLGDESRTPASLL